MNENNRNTTDSRSWKEKWEELQGFHRAAPILLVALAAFIVVCYCTAENGVLGNAISYVLMGLFSAGAWAIPVMLVIHAIFYADDLEQGRIPSRIIFSSITTVIISMVEYAITFSKNAPVGNPVTYFVEQRAGGFIGSALAYLMVEIFAWWGLIIIAVTVFAIYVAYFYSGSNSTVSKVFYTILEYIARFLALIERGVIDLFGLCKDFIAEKKQQKIEDKHLDVSFDAEEDEMIVCADKDAIYQVLYNLCHNAIKFSKNGGIFEINITQTLDKKIRVSVFDEGEMLSEEDMAHIFDRFYKSDKSRGLDKTGVGLGLYICKTIVDAHDEDITVTNRDGGVEFAFTLKANR